MSRKLTEIIDEVLGEVVEDVKNAVTSTPASNTSSQPDRRIARRPEEPAPLARRRDGGPSPEVLLLMQVKQFLGRNPAGKVRLVLESDEEVEAAVKLEHQGRGRVVHLRGNWIYEYEEQSTSGDWSPRDDED